MELQTVTINEADTTVPSVDYTPPAVDGTLNIENTDNNQTTTTPDNKVIVTLNTNHDTKMANKNTEKVGCGTIMQNLLVAAIVIWITVFISYKSVVVNVNLFSLHPSFMAFGYLIFMFHAILVIGEHALWGKSLKYSTRITFHWVLQFLAWILIGIGFAGVYYNKQRLGKHHFVSNHAICGLTTLIATQLIIFGGIWAKYSFKLRGVVRPAKAKLLHSFLGIVVYNLAIITISMGLYTQWWPKVSTDGSRQVIVIGLIISTSFVSYRPLKVCAKRLKSVCARPARSN